MQSVHDCILEQVEHSAAHRLRRIVPELEAEPLVGAAVEPEDNVGVDPVRCSAAVTSARLVDQKERDATGRFKELGKVEDPGCS